MVRPATQARRFALVPSPLQTDLSNKQVQRWATSSLDIDVPQPPASLAALLSPRPLLPGC
ncbi:hypothetical protein V8C40DRAFT_230228 [Trichoderma camerunense]